MSDFRAVMRTASVVARVVAGAVAVARLGRAARSAPPIRTSGAAATVRSAGRSPSIGVVVPARDEAGRIGPLLDRVVRAPGVDEVIVVDDESSDDTAGIARDHGATVLPGAPLPAGWAGKAWALHQGIAAATSEWVVTLDADTRPDPGLPTAVVARAVADGRDLVTVGGRFSCPTRGTRWLHAAMLTSLVYRFGPPGAPAAPGRMMANGQCTALHRLRFADAGGMEPVRGQVVEDVALARSMATGGRSVSFLDATGLLTVQMFDSLGDTWRGWGRSLALPGIEPLPRQLADLAMMALAQALPLIRVLVGRADPVDLALLALRIGTLAGTRRAYDRADAAYWLSPLADVVAVAAIARGIARGRRQTWRGRTYP
jgi:dolichol-phosphate mannosyltransferase